MKACCDNKTCSKNAVWHVLDESIAVYSVLGFDYV